MKETNNPPWENTNPKLASVLEELKKREPLFHRYEWGSKRPDFSSMVVSDFWEVGASGRRYAKDFVFDVIEKRLQNNEADIWETTEFHCRELGPDVYLLTYTLIQGENKSRLTRRSTIWRKEGSHWIAMYHQGTAIIL